MDQTLPQEASEHHNGNGQKNASPKQAFAVDRDEYRKIQIITSKARTSLLALIEEYKLTDPRFNELSENIQDIEESLLKTLVSSQSYSPSTSGAFTPQDYDSESSSLASSEPSSPRDANSNAFISVTTPSESITSNIKDSSINNHVVNASAALLSLRAGHSPSMTYSMTSSPSSTNDHHHSSSTKRKHETTASSSSSTSNTNNTHISGPQSGMFSVKPKPFIFNSESKTKVRRQRAKAAPSSGDLYCRACGETQTCEWRRGPDGYKSLCNACGIHFAKIVKKEESISSSYKPKALNLGMLLNN